MTKADSSASTTQPCWESMQPAALMGTPCDQWHAGTDKDQTVMWIKEDGEQCYGPGTQSTTEKWRNKQKWKRSSIWLHFIDFGDQTAECRIFKIRSWLKWYFFLDCRNTTKHVTKVSKTYFHFCASQCTHLFFITLDLRLSYSLSQDQLQGEDFMLHLPSAIVHPPDAAAGTSRGEKLLINTDDDDVLHW